MESWAAAGSGSNDVYLGNRLQYHDPQNVWLRSAMSAKGALLGILGLGTLLSLLLLIPIALLFHSSQYCTYGYGCYPSTGGFAPQSTWAFSLVGYVIAALWPRRESISQWELMLDGKADAAESAYATIAGALRDRKIPGKVKARRIRSSAGGTVRNYLTVKRGRYTLYVGVFPFGTSLFLTWSMWRQMSQIAIVWAGLSDALAALLLRNTEFHRVIRSDADRALREAVHNATREGVEAAVSGVGVSLTEVVGNVAIEDETPAQVATPVPVAPTPRPVPPSHSDTSW